jgi:ribosomal protein S18 acetylase RimI-like enzyme
MSLTYFKRFRMEIGLRRRPLVVPELPPGYRLVAWTDDRLADHAETKYQCFRNEIDALVFPCLGTPEGCLKLMTEIAERPAFLPSATWLMEFTTESGHRELCGMIQGMQSSARLGAIQNVGVTPFHRGRGIASALVVAALVGFQQTGLLKAYLEVTVQNDAAVKLYEQLGFAKVKTLYKAVEMAYS